MYVARIPNNYYIRIIYVCTLHAIHLLYKLRMYPACHTYIIYPTFVLCTPCILIYTSMYAVRHASIINYMYVPHTPSIYYIFYLCTPHAMYLLYTLRIYPIRHASIIYSTYVTRTSCIYYILYLFTHYVMHLFYTLRIYPIQ